MKTQQNFIDPVCQMTVSAQKDTPTTRWEGETVYFCSDSCKSKFMLKPKNFFKAAEPRRMGFWQKYLNRLNKATGGKPPSCCQ